jgi:hypothetical protein
LPKDFLVNSNSFDCAKHQGPTAYWSDQLSDTKLAVKFI